MPIVLAGRKQGELKNTVQKRKNKIERTSQLFASFISSIDVSASYWSLLNIFYPLSHLVGSCSLSLSTSVDALEVMTCHSKMILAKLLSDKWTDSCELVHIIPSFSCLLTQIMATPTWNCTWEYRPWKGAVMSLFLDFCGSGREMPTTHRDLKVLRKKISPCWWN